MHDGPDSPLTLDQAHEAASLWMSHVGEPPSEIVEKGPHAVELRSARLNGFVRVPDQPLSQRTVLAVLAAESEGRKRVIFSASGFTPSAISIAEAQGIALFSLASDGIAHPMNRQASALANAETPPAPFTPAPQAEESLIAEYSEWGTSDFSADEWVDCPGCGTNQHHTLDACRLCGASLTESAAPVGAPSTDTGPSIEEAASLGPTPDGLEYRCRECGSQSIEVVAANDPANRM